MCIWSSGTEANGRYQWIVFKSSSWWDFPAMEYWVWREEVINFILKNYIISKFDRRGWTLPKSGGILCVRELGGKSGECFKKEVSHGAERTGKMRLKSFRGHGREGRPPHWDGRGKSQTLRGAEGRLENEEMKGTWPYLCCKANDGLLNILRFLFFTFACAILSAKGMFILACFSCS